MKKGTVFTRHFILLMATITSVIFVNAQTPAPKNLYVATNGNDNAAGTKEAPLKTLAKAQAVVRALKTKDNPVTVWVRGGTYYLTAPLEFTPVDNGSVKAPITYSAYPNEDVVISGGVKLNPKWSTYSGNTNIRVTNIGKGYDFDMLFLNEDKLLTMARYPNYDATKVPLQGCGDISDRVAGWANPAGGFIRSMHKNGWGGESFKITGKTGTTLNLTWVGDNNRGSVANTKRQVAENIFEELDAPGEWFYDRANGNLYIYPPTGTDLNKNWLVGATQEELIRVVGTETQKVKYLTFSGFTLTHTHRTLFTSNYEGLSQGDWSIARKGAVFMQEAENIIVKNCNFLNLGGNGLFMSGHNQDNLVTGCNFVHLGATAVAVAGLPISTQYYCNWTNNKQKPSNFTPGPASENYPKNITISYCYVYDNGMFEKQTSAVLISISQAVTVSHCTAHFGPRSGINIEDGTFGGHIIEYNDVFNEVRETSDHGPFNSWGRDRWWQRMSAEEERKYALLDILQPNTIRNNRFHNPEGHASFGIDLDDGSSNYIINNNLLINCGFKSQLGFNHTIFNNIVINAQATFHQWSLPDMQKNITHNIFINKSPYYCRTRDFKPNTGSIDYNLFWNNGSPVTLEIDNGKDGGGEISAVPTWTQYKLDEHSLTADPLFGNSANGDYTVKEGSPALKLGFKNFQMDQFGKPGYPVPQEFQMTKPREGDRFAGKLFRDFKPVISENLNEDLGPVGIP